MTCQLHLAGVMLLLPLSHQISKHRQLLGFELAQGYCTTVMVCLSKALWQNQMLQVMSNITSLLL